MYTLFLKVVSTWAAAHLFDRPARCTYARTPAWGASPWPGHVHLKICSLGTAYVFKHLYAQFVKNASTWVSSAAAHLSDRPARWTSPQKPSCSQILT